MVIGTQFIYLIKTEQAQHLFNFKTRTIHSKLKSVLEQKCSNKFKVPKKPLIPKYFY